MSIPYKLVKNSHLEALKALIVQKEQAIERASHFVQEIERGNLDIAFGDDVTEESDSLKAALISMRDQLKKVSIDEKERNWITEGLAKFADILRKDSDDIQHLADNILSNLVKYMQVNQGALFILHENQHDDPYLELAACYAYDRKKFLQKRINIGEGLVGQIFLEKELMYLTEVPDRYVSITSGLGAAPPKNILIVPLKVNEQVYGVMELASFHDIQPYRQDFVQKLGESIASTISSTRIANQTKILLEESQQQTEEMRAQEEEVRQNMEELSATQEEMQRKVAETENRIKAIENSGIASVEFDLRGNILTANENFLTIMGYTLQEIQGRHHQMFVSSGYANSEEYRQFWQDLSSGRSQVGEFTHFKKHGETVYLRGSYSVISDNNGNPLRLITLATDVSDTKRAFQEAQEQAEELKAQAQTLQDNADEFKAMQEELMRMMTEMQEKEHFLEMLLHTAPNPVVAFDRDFKLISFNKAFEMSLHATGKVCEKGISVLELFLLEEKEVLVSLWNSVLEGETLKHVFQSSGQYVEATFSPFKNTKGEVTGIISHNNDITALVKSKQAGALQKKQK